MKTLCTLQDPNPENLKNLNKSHRITNCHTPENEEFPILMI